MAKNKLFNLHLVIIFHTNNITIYFVEQQKDNLLLSDMEILKLYGEKWFVALKLWILNVIKIELFWVQLMAISTFGIMIRIFLITNLIQVLLEWIFIIQ